VNVPFSLFIPALETEFHWTRSTITAALSVFLQLLVVSLPLAGRLVDRVGARRVALPSVLAYGLALASVAFVTPAPAHFYAHYGAIAVLGAGAQSLTFRARAEHLVRTAARSHDRRVHGGLRARVRTRAARDAGDDRRLGLACRVRGSRGTRRVRNAARHRAAAPRHAGGARTPARDGTAARREAPDRATVPPLAEALRTREFWLLAAIFVLMSAALNGVQAQLVPLLTDRGLSAATAALMLSPSAWARSPDG
jgi:hypothetical protein